ncbi:MAG: hypothetical protein ACRDLL_06780 [Solirubrobacterales bacterium]
MAGSLAVVVPGSIVGAMASPGAAIVSPVAMMAAVMMVVTMMAMSMFLMVARGIIWPVARLTDAHATDRHRSCGSDDGHEL